MLDGIAVLRAGGITARWCGTRPGRPARSEFAFHFADAAARVEEHARSVRVRSVAGEGGAGSSGRRADGAGPEGEPRSFWTDLRSLLHRGAQHCAEDAEGSRRCGG